MSWLISLQWCTRAVRIVSRAWIAKWKRLTHRGIRTRCLPLRKRTRHLCAKRSDVCGVVNSLQGFTWGCYFCPPPFTKAGDIKTHRPSACLSVRLSVTKTLTWLISSEVLMIEHWYLACMILVTSHFYWYHVVTLTSTFDLLQGQSCCRAGDHNSSNLLVFFLEIYL